MAAYITSSNPSWFSVFGPTIGSEAVEPTTATQAIYIEDHYDPAMLAQQLTRPDITVITEYFHHAPAFGQFTTISYPIWLYYVSKCFNNLKIAENFETRGCFNFMLFKQREFRLKALRTIEKFDLRTDYYTANVMENEFDHKPRVFGDPKPNCYDFRGDYEQFLAAQVFDPTAVSLIIEPIELPWQDLIGYTEKSLYPVLSCTFPIWVGGRLQAQGWHELGFDAFDDVIDHSYQSVETSQQRMELAIERNLRILTDLDHAKKMRELHMPRLLENRSRLLGQSVRPYLDQIKNSFPSHIQIIIEDIEKSWIKKMYNKL
jgi:hypothetical protein